MKGLWVVCCPLRPAVASLPAPSAHPLLEPWVVAVSRSARARNLHRSLTESCVWFPTESQDELLARLPAFDLVVFSPLSLNSLAKIALGIRDSLPTRLFGAAQEAGKAILLDKREIPGNDAGRDAGMNPHLIKVYRRYWETLTGGTIGEYLPERFDLQVQQIARSRLSTPPTPAPTGRRVFTRDDVWEARHGLGVLSVPRGSLVTDLAREEAEKLGIVIEFA